MKGYLILLIIVIFQSGFGQEISPPHDLSVNEKISLDAYIVFQTNKFLDFKDRDSLVKLIDGKVYEKSDLNNYFGYKKNWKEVENEDFNTYKKDDERFNYAFTNNTMIETYHEFGNYDVRREIKVIYNQKGFVLECEEKVFVGENYNETRIIINEFDPQNRVTKIINRTERTNKDENSESIITAVYEGDLVKISSDHGSIICKFIKDKNSVGFISKLSPRDTSNRFMYALIGKRFDIAADQCTDKMAKEMEVYSNLNNQIEEAKFVSGTDKYSQDIVRIEDVWEIKYSITDKAMYQVNFVLVKQKNGWKIDEFKIVSK